MKQHSHLSEGLMRAQIFYLFSTLTAMANAQQIINVDLINALATSLGIWRIAILCKVTEIQPRSHWIRIMKDQRIEATIIVPSSDLVISESVFQVSRGNFDRSKAFDERWNCSSSNENRTLQNCRICWPNVSKLKWLTFVVMSLC